VPNQFAAAWEGRNAEYWRQAWGAAAVHFFERVTSTNDLAADLAATGATDLTIVVAEEQTRGRGRGGASWQAERGSSLLFSVLLCIEELGAAPGCAPVRAGLAVAEAISHCSGAEAGLKWPNDVVYSNRGKVAGVLCEGTLGQQGAGYVIVGIGINVLQSADAFDADLRGRACSILSATAVRLDRGALVSEVMTKVRAFGGSITQPLTDAELQRIGARDVLRDREIVCETGAGKTLSGIARGIARDGALRLEQSNGVTMVYNATVRLADAHAYPGSGRG
jgi:BirA family biotin operon repressor/biotin-[acetyl-CoA-carboxylase] ligase